MSKENIQCPFCKSTFEIIVAGVSDNHFYGCDHKFEQILEDAKEGTAIGSKEKKWRCFKCLEVRTTFD